GPLISTDMTRCIHCTRCVRFGQEIAGVMELGMAGRGEHSEILAFVGKTVDSELSGNSIDLCPVGALTSKPFRYSARTWELARRRSVSPHCGLGANLVMQVKGNRVMRVLPFENEAVNECWLSDKDRFSYEALNSETRLARPMIRRDGTWVETDWATALETVAAGLKRVRDTHGADQIATLASPHATLEELALAAKLTRGLGSANIDFRLRQRDSALDGTRRGAPWLGMPVSAIGQLKRVVVIGSNLRKDHPLIAQRFRQAAKQGTQLAFINATDDDPLMPVAAKAIVAPSRLPAVLAQVLAAVAAGKGVSLESSIAALGGEPDAAARSIAALLTDGEPAAVFLGNFAQHHPQASAIEVLAQQLAAITGASFGILGEAANSVGGYLAGAVPEGNGKTAAQSIAQPVKAYVLLHTEPEFDLADGAGALAALNAAEFVVALSPFGHRAAEYADVMLPIAPFTETSGTFISTEGRVQSFKGVVQPLGDTRPAWKVLRVLGNLLDLPGFGYDSSEQVRDEVLGGSTDVAARLDNTLTRQPAVAAVPAVAGLERIGDVPIYFADPVVRRAPSLQKTRDALPPQAWMRGETLAALGLVAGDAVRVRSGAGSAELFVGLDDRLPAGCVRIAGAHPQTAMLGPLDGIVTVEPLPGAARVNA
ncbi:MAG: molybdopterin-dependent oxidoreductase, partial [Burkholderiales bacterium]|nr:molybdopterin-dependent oxidoreductase [Burkholderiales bacterium]